MSARSPIALSLLLVLLPACRQDTKTKTVLVPEKPWYEGAVLQEKFSGSASLLSMANPSCQSHAADLPLDGISSIFEGQKIRTTLDVLLRSSSEQKERKEEKALVDDRKGIFICDVTGAPDTVESMATKIVSDISAAHAFYLREAGSEARPLPIIEVEVQPVDETSAFYRYDDEFIAQNKLSLEPIETEPFRMSGTDVNNAFYIPNSEAPVIAFLPHNGSDSPLAAMFPQALWDIPTVARHEYGHHVFAQHFKAIFGQLNFDYLQLVRDNPLRHGTLLSPGQTAVLTNHFPNFDSYFLISALNEGFADLFAHATFEGVRSDIQNPCMGQTREVDAPLLNGSTYRKTWSAPLLDYMLGRSKEAPKFEEGDAGCAGFSIHDPHHIGALIAHSAYRILSVSAAVENASDKPNELFRQSLAWVNRLAETMDPASDGPYLFLSQSLLTIVDVARAGSAPSPALCAAIGEQFPGFKELWTKRAVDPSILACLP